MTLAVRQLHPTRLIGRSVTPPEYRGQPIEVSFATCGRWIYRRTHDRIAQSKVYHRTDASHCKASDFEPWKRAPQIPEERWQFCTAEQAGDT